MTHPNEDLARQANAAFARGDLAALRTQFFAENIRWHIPGRGPLAGDYEGVTQVIELFGRIFELSGGTARIELHDVLANDNHTVSLATIPAERAGKQQPSNGEARLMRGFTVGMLDQEPALDESKTVLGNVEEGVAETKALLERYNEIAEQLATDYSDALLEEMGRLQEQLDHREAWDLDSQLEQAMDALRCPPPDTSVSILSGGERRRVALCKLLLQQPDLLLLGEPTHHLDADSVLRLEQHLEKYPGTVVAVTHDRYFLDNVAGSILDLHRGHAYPYQGKYATHLD